MEEKLESTIFDLVGRIDKALLEDDLEMSSLRQELHDRDDELSLIRKKMSDLQTEIDLTMSQLHQSQQELHDRDAELSLIRKKMSDLQIEIDLTMSQLHQSQQELHRYYLLCQKQSAMLSVSEEIHARSFALIAASCK